MPPSYAHFGVGTLSFGSSTCTLASGKKRGKIVADLLEESSRGPNHQDSPKTRERFHQQAV